MRQFEGVTFLKSISMVSIWKYNAHTEGGGAIYNPGYLEQTYRYQVLVQSALSMFGHDDVCLCPQAQVSIKLHNKY